MLPQPAIVTDVLLEFPMVCREQIMGTVRTPQVCHARYAAAQLMIDAGYDKWDIIRFFNRDRTWADKVSTHARVTRAVWLVKRRWQERSQAA